MNKAAREAVIATIKDGVRPDVTKGKYVSLNTDEYTSFVLRYFITLSGIRWYAIYRKGTYAIVKDIKHEPSEKWVYGETDTIPVFPRRA